MRLGFLSGLLTRPSAEDQSLKGRLWKWAGWLASQRAPRRVAHTNSASLLDAVESQPQRLKPVTDAFKAATTVAGRVGQAVIRRFTQFGGSFADIFCINELVSLLRQADAAAVVQGVAPYLLAGLAESLHSEAFSDSDAISQSSLIKFAAGCMVLGVSMSHRITEQARSKNTALKVMQQAASVWSLFNLHAISFNAGYALSDSYLAPLARDNFITEDTQESVNLITALIATSVALPKLLLLMCDGINRFKTRFEAFKGQGTQSAKNARIPNGLTPEVNVALQFYDHFTKALSDPSRLFQYFIVSLNVLKDIDIPDPTASVPTKMSKRAIFVKKTRNLWLLAVESFLKAKADLKNRLSDVAHDRAINLQVYQVFRNGVMLPAVYRHELVQGDLVRLEQAVKNVFDPAAGTTRTKATLSGYLVQLGGGGEQALKKVAISLAELNGESKPLILEPLRKPKLKSECVPIDLLRVAATAAIFPGTEFISFDNGNPDATIDGLFVQIAATHEVTEPIEAKVAFSTRQIADLKTKLINGVLALSAIGAVTLMRRDDPSSDVTKQIIFYGTEFIAKFTQVFVEAQTLIPLTSDVMLDLANSELVRDLNERLSDKVTVNRALSMADLFEFIHKKKVSIYSDKTGTVTETRMILRDIICSNQDRVLMGFATTFSDQKTEAEENEIRRYYETERKIKIDSKPIPGKLGQLEKTVSKALVSPVHFVTKPVGLFTEFGGQFTIREQQGKPPVLVFCGSPRAEYSGGTRLMKAHEAYEQAEKQANLLKRQDSLTRDWSIAEVALSPQEHKVLLDAIDRADLQLQKQCLYRVRDGFEYLGTFQIDNPIKAGAREAIQKWKRAGIGFMMITGDTKAAARLIAAKLFPDQSEKIYDMDELQALPNWQCLDLSRSTVILSDTKPKTIELASLLEASGAKRPNIIFCQMKDVDKKNLVVHAKKQGKFVIANGDGCNDLLMLKAAHIAIGDAARDGSFARDVQECSTFTDSQVSQLMKRPDKTFYQLLDLEEGRKSKFLQHFAPLANTQPKVITSLLGKALKSVAVPRALGSYTREIPGQFGILLGYDSLFLAATYQGAISTADTPLLDRPVNQSSLPYITLLASVAIAAAQSFYCYSQHNRQITTGSVLLANLVASVGCLSLFLAPPGYAPKK